MKTLQCFIWWVNCTNNRDELCIIFEKSENDSYIEEKTYSIQNDPLRWYSSLSINYKKKVMDRLRFHYPDDMPKDQKQWKNTK